MQCYVDFEEFKIETDIDDESLTELYEVFLEELLQEKEKLLSLYEIKDFEKMGKVVHNIKGISGSYKAQMVFETSRLIDIDIKKSEYESIDEKLFELLKAIDDASLYINEHILAK